MLVWELCCEFTRIEHHKIWRQFGFSKCLGNINSLIISKTVCSSLLFFLANFTFLNNWLDVQRSNCNPFVFRKFWVYN